MPRSLPTPCEIVGDAHLGVASPESERALLQYLRTIPGRARSLVIMGDLFDFWFAWRHVMPRTGFRVLSAIADAREAGLEVLWLGGNHDCWSGDTLQELTGASYTLENWTGRIGPWRVHLAHGDGLRDKEDAPYRRLRRVLRHPLAIKAFGWLHPDHATALAQGSSNTSRHRVSRDEGRGLMRVASTQLTGGDLDLVVHGHSHVAQLSALERGWYANAGAWYIDQQYLRIDGDELARIAWSGSGEGDRLDVVDRTGKEALPERMESLGRI